MSNEAMELNMGMQIIMLAIDREASLDERIDQAFKEGKHLWFTLDDDMRFRCSVAALHQTSSEDEQDRIMAEINAIKSLSAMMSGVPVAMDSFPFPEDPIGLVKRWKEFSDANKV